MNSYSEGNLKITVTESDSGITLEWRGKSAGKHPEKLLKNYLDTMAEAIGITQKPLTLEFQEIAFMNTSTYPIIIVFLENLDRNGVQTKVVYDKNAHWQVVSFKGLDQLAKIKMKNITIIGV